MGWYDDEEDGRLPEWMVKPIMWGGCLLTACLPAAVAVAAWERVLPRASPVVVASAYLVSLGLLLAAVKPWTIR